MCHPCARPRAKLAPQRKCSFFYWRQSVQKNETVDALHFRIFAFLITDEKAMPQHYYCELCGVAWKSSRDVFLLHKFCCRKLYPREVGFILRALFCRDIREQCNRLVSSREMSTGAIFFCLRAASRQGAVFESGREGSRPLQHYTFRLVVFLLWLCRDCCACAVEMQKAT